MNKITGADFRVSYRTSNNNHYHCIEKIESVEIADIDGIYSLLVWFPDGEGEAIPLTDVKNLYVTVDRHFDFVEGCDDDGIPF